jgi:hypothetical protein
MKAVELVELVELGADHVRAVQSFEQFIRENKNKNKNKNKIAAPQTLDSRPHRQRLTPKQMVGPQTELSCAGSRFLLVHRVKDELDAAGNLKLLENPVQIVADGR